SAAVVGSEIVVLGGFTADGGSSRRVDAYSPARDTWRRLPDLPVGVNHAMAISGRLVSRKTLISIATKLFKPKD
ncbi:MAG: kelch repeat-containing protein, partial [Micrococcales bacterium]